MPDRESFFGFGFRVFAYLAAGLMVTDVLLYYTTNHGIGESYYEAMVILNTAKHTTMITTLTVNAVVHLIILVVTLTAAIILTHRISGPMYRFEQFARTVGGGDLSVNIKLRDNDYMKQQANELNSAITAMRERMKTVAEYSAAMRDKLDSLDGKDPVEAEKLLMSMKSELDEMKAALSHFKTN